jgi:hypothetical protein
MINASHPRRVVRFAQRAPAFLYTVFFLGYSGSFLGDQLTEDVREGPTEWPGLLRTSPCALASFRDPAAPARQNAKSILATAAFVTTSAPGSATASVLWEYSAWRAMLSSR